MNSASYIGQIKDLFQKLDYFRRSQFPDLRCNALHSTGNGAEPVGTFLTIGLFVIGDSVFQPLLLMLQLFQFLFVADQVFLEQFTLRVFLIHFKISFQFFCWDSRNAAQGEPLSGMHMTQKAHA